MNLAGARLEDDTSTYPINKGWVNSLSDDRQEARGYFTMYSGHRPNLQKSDVILYAGGVRFTVILLQFRAGQTPEENRWNFIASCDPGQVRPLLEPNPNITRTQEFFLSKDLEAEIQRAENENVKLGR